MMDEVAIRKQLDFDTATDMFVGYVDIRVELDDMQLFCHVTIGVPGIKKHVGSCGKKLLINVVNYFYCRRL